VSRVPTNSGPRTSIRSKIECSSSALPSGVALAQVSGSARSLATTWSGAMPDPRGDVAIGDGDVEDQEHDQDEGERRSSPDPGGGVVVGPAAVRLVTMVIAHAGAVGRSTRRPASICLLGFRAIGAPQGDVDVVPGLPRQHRGQDG